MSLPTPLYLLPLLFALSCGGKSESSEECGAQGDVCCSDGCSSGLRCGDGRVCVVEEPLSMGYDCITSGDCSDGYCEPLGDRQICVAACTSLQSCHLSGWDCDQASKRCSCDVTPEMCNTVDDDCNGVIDDASAADADCDRQLIGSNCVEGRCRCAVDQCDHKCVDLKTDESNCGACGVACETGEYCVSGACEKPSCQNGLKCNDESCCVTLPVEGGTFPMGRSLDGTDVYPLPDYLDHYGETPEHEVSVSSYHLDKYEVTVGRMRNFVEAYGTWRAAGHPIAGEGAHPLIPGSGWSTEWKLPTDEAALRESLKCDHATETWTDKREKRESQPINCVSWPVAFAFCLWDLGRLPTEAEWEYAAAGGSENRLVPWGGNANTNGCSIFVTCECTASEDQCVADDFFSVGSLPDGNGRYGQSDLVGNADEWVLDGYAPDWYSTGGASCNDCANLDWSQGNITRGGSVGSRSFDSYRSAFRIGGQFYSDAAVGMRCARDLIRE